MANRLVSLAIVVSGFGLTESGECQIDPDKARSTLAEATQYFGETVALNGGYVYFYSPDLSRRLGEGAARPTEIWVQPPGTPTVGMAYLEAFDATGDDRYRDYALQAGEALMYGQLKSGGWRNQIDFDPSGPRVDEYRNGKGRGKNFSSLDDDITQAALEFLIRLDAAFAFENEKVHEAAKYGLERLLQAQFSNGAFPQGWNGPAREVQTVPASYPDYEWRTEGRIKKYWDQFTLNDGMAGSVSATLIAAHEIYRQSEYLDALKKLGDFLVLAQLPEPQRGWAQQYNEEMKPIWARAFEPPAISGRESEDVMKALIRIAEYTDDNRYLEPVVGGVKYLENSLLSDGQLARYYELKSNRPLYMERKGKVYSLTYDDSNLPSHYGWKSKPELEKIKDAYRARLASKPVSPILEPVDGSSQRAASVTATLTSGRWLSTYLGEKLIGQAKFQLGEDYISSEVFSNNVRILSEYLRRSGR